MPQDRILSAHAGQMTLAKAVAAAAALGTALAVKGHFSILSQVAGMVANASPLSTTGWELATVPVRANLPVIVALARSASSSTSPIPESACMEVMRAVAAVSIHPEALAAVIKGGVIDGLVAQIERFLRLKSWSRTLLYVTPLAAISLFPEGQLAVSRASGSSPPTTVSTQFCRVHPNGDRGPGGPRPVL